MLTVLDGTIVVVSGHPAERGTFEFYLEAMQMQHLREDPRFGDVASRLANLEALQQIIREWALGVPDADELERRLAEHQLAMGRLRSVDEVAATDWAREREAIIQVSDRGGGTVRIPNSPWHFSGSETAVRGVPKFRGEDNSEVLRDLLDMSEEQVARMYNDGVLVERLPKK